MTKGGLLIFFFVLNILFALSLNSQISFTLKKYDIEDDLYNNSARFILDRIQEITPGILCVKTRKKGIFRIKYLNNDSVEYLSGNKLSPGTHIEEVFKDDKGRIWIYTSTGLYRYQSDTVRFANFEDYFSDLSITKGLFSEDVSTSFNNKMFFGKTNGLFSFFPNKMEKSYSEHPIVFTDFYLFNSLVKPEHHDFLPVPIEHQQEINLKHDQNFFAMEFTCLNLSSYDNITYAYKLENFENYYNYTNESNIAIYKSVPPGNYKFVLKVSNDGSDLGHEIKSININIARPYWNTVRLSKNLHYMFISLNPIF